MNLLELAEELEEQEQNHRAWSEHDEEKGDDGLAEYHHGCANGLGSAAKQLRAALSEQPLSRKWRGEADEIEKSEGEPIAPEDGQVPETLRRCAAELDSQRDRDRELLRRAVDRLETTGAAEAMLRGTNQNQDLADEIRNHLEEPSDEA